MTKKITHDQYAVLQSQLKIDCEKCSGLCCTALYCMKTDGFPSNKEAGVPCSHLLPDFRCDIHEELASKNMRGCLSYDCFGAGQKVTEKYPSLVNWKSAPHKAAEIFEVFLAVTHLHQMQWYLLEALSLVSEDTLRQEIQTLLAQNEQITGLSPTEILAADINTHRLHVNKILKQLTHTLAAHTPKGTDHKSCLGKNFKGANLDNVDFSMGILIGADLKGCSLCSTNFLGADMRDAKVHDTDLTSCVFLTQMQLNATKGNAHTKLPAHLHRPASW